MSSKPVPHGFHTLTPYIAVKNVPGLISFLKAAFGAKEKHVSALGDGTIMNAVFWIGDSVIMLGELPEGSPFGTRSATVYMYVEDADSVYEKAIAAGATSLMEPADQFYGDRNAGVEDAWGNQWWIATHIEDVSVEEIKRRMAAAAKPS